MSWKSSKSETSRILPRTVVVGRIRKPHGVRGEMLVDVVSDVDGRFAAGSELGVVLVDGRRWQARIAASRLAGKTARVRLKGVETREGAEELRGASLEIDRQDVPPAPSGTYYFFELVGCLCIDRKHGELGRVEAVIDDGGGLLLEVRDDQRALLVPFVKSYLRKVEVSARRIELELPEGLIEICASRW